MSYIPEPYIDREGIGARNQPRILTEVLNEKPQFLDPKPERTEEQGQKFKPAVGRKQFIKAMKKIYTETADADNFAENQFNLLNNRVPNIDTLNMNVLAIAQYLRFEFNLSSEKIDIQTNFQQVLTKNVKQIYQRYNGMFEGVVTLFSKAEKLTSEGLFLDVHRYIEMLIKFDFSWSQQQIEKRRQQSF